MKDLRFIFVRDNAAVDTQTREDVNAFLDAADAFDSKFKKAQTQQAEYDVLKKQKDNSWRELKDYFLKLSKYRCPICECVIGKYDDIEHYRPKTEYWWLAYDYKNYYACCSDCNRDLKHETFPLFDDTKKVSFNTRDQIDGEQALLFNPTADDPLELFNIECCFDINGRGKVDIHAHCTLEQDEYKHSKAIKTIEVYQLNNQQKNPAFIAKQNSLFNELHNLMKLKHALSIRPTERNFVLYKQQLHKTKNVDGIGLALLIDSNTNCYIAGKMHIIE